MNINLWEAPIAAHLAGQIKGLFPSFLVRTDQERIQNLKKYFEQFGKVEDSVIMVDKETGLRPCFTKEMRSFLIN